MMMRLNCINIGNWIYNSLTSYHRILHSIPLATEEDDDMLFGKILELICLMYNFNRDLRFALIQDEIA